MKQDGKNNLKGRVDAKLEGSRKLDQIVMKNKWVDVTSALLGYTLGHFDLKRHQGLVKKLVSVFTLLKQKLNDKKQLRHKDVVMIAYDLVQEMRSMLEKGEELLQGIADILNDSIEGMSKNKSYIIEKWKCQQIRQNRTCQCCRIVCDLEDLKILPCGHNFHTNCLKSYLTGLVESNRSQIPCPAVNCNQILQDRIIFSYLSQSLRQRYEQYQNFNLVESHPDSLTWCPTYGCKAWFEFGKGAKLYPCPCCLKRYCLDCGSLQHVDMSCADYQIRRNPLQRKINTRQHKFKRCPTCNAWTQRRRETMTMKCACGQEFCFKCGGFRCSGDKCSDRPLKS